MKSAYSQQSSNIRNTWLLLFIFIGIVSFFSTIISLYYGNISFAFIGLGYSIVQAFIAYRFGDAIALQSANAQEVSPSQAPQIHTIVENLSKIAGIPKPKIYISPDPSANAFATGRNPENASICINQGLISLLNKAELEAVIAHELSHIKNRDILIMTVTMVLASLITIISDLGIRMSFFSRNDDKNSQSPIVIFLFIISIILAPIVAILIQMAVSRSREYLADASAVVMTRYPEGLMSALTKLYQSPVPTNHYSSAMSHFYISPPKKEFGEKVQSLFSTHPSIEERVKALRSM